MLDNNDIAQDIMAESPSEYSNQLEQGFKALQFPSKLEQDFNQFYYLRNLPRNKSGAWVALFVVIAMSISDTFRLPAELWTITGFLHLIQALIIIYILQKLYGGSDDLQMKTKLFIGILSIGFITTAITSLINSKGYFSPNTATILNLMYCYLILGFTIRRALLSAMLITVSSIVFFTILQPEGFNHILNIVHLVFINAFCATASYFIEHVSRENFLRFNLLKELALFDELTSLYNRRAFHNHINSLYKQSKREKKNFSIGFIDVDNFKKFNDDFGHLEGDKALRIISECLNKLIKRPLDMVARYGGEEFAVLWYDCDVNKAKQLADAMRKAVLDLNIEHPKSSSLKKISISLGVCDVRTHPELDIQLFLSQ
ncbi:MAG: hypothetical protein COC19_08120, partial [SAR86 cluster bacterium]